MIKNSKGGITSRCNCQCFFMLLRAFCKNAGPLLFGNDLRCNTISFSRTIPPKQMSVIFDSAFYGLIIDDFYLQKKGTLGDFSVQIALSEEHKIAVERPFFQIAGLKSEKRLHRPKWTVQPYVMAYFFIHPQIVYRYSGRHPSTF